MLAKVLISLCGLALGAGGTVAVNTDASVDSHGDRSGVVVESNLDADADASLWATNGHTSMAALIGFTAGGGAEGHFGNDETGGSGDGSTDGTAGPSGAIEGTDTGVAGGTTGEGSGTVSDDDDESAEDSSGSDDGVGNGTESSEGDGQDAFFAKCASLAATAGLTVDADGSVNADSSGAMAEADLTAGAALWLWIELGCG